MSKRNDISKESQSQSRISELEQQNSQYLQAFSVTNQKLELAQTMLGKEAVEKQQLINQNQQLQQQVQQLQTQLNQSTEATTK